MDFLRLRAAGVNFAVVVTAVAFALAAGELGLRIGGVEFSAAVENARLVRRGNPAFPTHDSRGFRNPAALERADVVLLGDSQTYGRFVPPQHTWGRILAEETGLAVYNMAFNDWGLMQGALILRDALALKPQTVVYTVFLGNDILNALEYPPGQPPRFPKSPPPRCGWPLRIQPEPSASRSFLLRYSRVYGLVRLVYFGVYYPEMPLWGSEVVRRLAESAPQDGYTWFEGAQWRGVLNAAYRLCAMDDSDPRIRGGFEMVKSTLLAMAGDAEAEGAAFAVFLLPTKESVFAPRVADFDAHEGLAGLVAAESRLRGELTAVLRAHDIPVLDLLPPLRDAPEQPFPASDDFHPNLAGSRVIGLEAARFVRRIDTLSRSTSR